MYQQQTSQPHDEREWKGSENEYEAGYAGNLQQSDQLADAIARRLQAQTPSALQVPAHIAFNRNPNVISAGQRLALAIVSVTLLVPLSGIALGVLQSQGLIAMGIIGAVILGINIVFNRHG
jgi:hypothetical protein